MLFQHGTAPLGGNLMPQHQGAARWALTGLCALAFACASRLSAEGLILVGQPAVLAGTASVAASTSTPAGELEIVWEDVDADDYGIFAQQYSAEGVAQGGRQALNQATAGYQLHPAVTTVPS